MKNRTDVKETWLYALRSGDFQQGEGQESMCAIRVLNEACGGNSEPNEFYTLFFEVFGNQACEHVWSANDYGYRDGDRHFEMVIDYIENHL